MRPPVAASPDASSSDDEGAARKPQAPPAYASAAPPPRSFDELLQQASALKTCQLREKRRAFEAAPSFFQYTLAYDGDAATNELRLGPAAARLAAAAALKAAGNAALQAAPGGAPAAEQALQQYTKALSFLRYFAKASGASDEERVRRVELDAGDAAGCSLAAAVLLNCAACCAAAGRPPSEARWACDEALAALAAGGPACAPGQAAGDAMRAKALYRRAQAWAAEGTTEAAEEAARDAAAAAKLAPKDPAVRAAAREHAAAAASARSAASSAAARALRGGALYGDAPAGVPSAARADTLDAAAPSEAPPLSEAELVAAASAAGLDLDDGATRAALGAEAAAELRCAARSMGLDPEHPRLAAALDALDKRALAALPRRTAKKQPKQHKQPLLPQSLPRRLLSAFAAASAPGRTLTPQRLLYALLALRLAAQLYRVLLSRGDATDHARFDDEL